MHWTAKLHASEKKPFKMLWTQAHKTSSENNYGFIKFYSKTKKMREYKSAYQYFKYAFQEMCIISVIYA